MQISDTMQDNVCQVSLEGRFDANTAGYIEQFLRGRMGEGCKRFVLDMENVPFVASAGLRVVLVIAKELRQQDHGDLRIAALQPNVNKVFEISGLKNVLQLFDTVDEATQSFAE